MFDKIQKSILNGLQGTHVHVNPFKALEGLDADTAKKVPPNGGHSCWQILYHIVYWQDFMLPHLRKEEVNWGIEEAEAITKTIDSFENLPTDPKVPSYAALMVFIEHNAYHVGQIVATRQAIGAWPPPDYKKTF